MKYLPIFLMSFSLFASSELSSLLDKVDKVYRSKSSTATMLMTIKTPHWKRKLEMKTWTKGMEQTFITIISPRKEKGISTLKKDNEMWNYFPKINKVIKVPPSMMMGSWMGSDFTNDDLVRENTFAEDFNVRLISKIKNIYTVELIPKEKTITVWGKIILVVDGDKLIPINEDFFDEKGKLARTMTFSKVQKKGKRYFPMMMSLKSLSKPGNETIVEYRDLIFDAKVKNSAFTMKNLQKRR